MARRHAPTQRWHVGDACQVPWYRSGRVGGWSGGEVVAVRGERVVVRRWRFESVHPWWEPRKPPPHRGLWQRWWNHDKR